MKHLDLNWIWVVWIFRFRYMVIFDPRSSLISWNSKWAPPVILYLSSLMGFPYGPQLLLTHYPPRFLCSRRRRRRRRCSLRRSLGRRRRHSWHHPKVTALWAGWLIGISTARGRSILSPPPFLSNLFSKVCSFLWLGRILKSFQKKKIQVFAPRINGGFFRTLPSW